ncbi:VCBS repeat-containing protein [Streptomyces sp. NK15101]|uniref:FG-GAP repeat domain-containing protein n=1 Tax=Streptomyces sp. NK15101 TaxID=2873261 RepID=UPI001CEDCE3D|nr:VCBS repeat-containing protein [Streptomyces sp. NK15101]
MRTALSRRVSMSVGVVLAVVASTPFLGPAATAAPTPTAAVAPAAETATAPIQVPFLASGGDVLGAGKTGFLTRDADGVERWTRYSDGVSKVVGGDGYGVLGSASDIVVTTKARLQRYGIESATAYDMETGAAPVTFGGFEGYVRGGVGAALFDEDTDNNIRLVTKDGSRDIAGLENPVPWFSVSDSLPDTALVLHPGNETTGRSLLVVDLVGARVSEKYPESAGVTMTGASLTKDRVVWVEKAKADGKTVLATAGRGSTDVTRVPLPYDHITPVDGGLMGDWLVASGDPETGGGAAGGLSAYPLADGTPVELLDYAEDIQKSADGTLLVLGTTADRGPGVYRIAVGADGKPAAELIASTGEPPAPTTPISFTSAAVPAALDLDGVAKTRLSWKFSTTKADLTIEFKHRASGRLFRTAVRPRATGTGVYPDGSLGIDWAGETGWDGNFVMAARNGAYDWKVTARPWNGMPSVTATGSFEVKRSPQLHDDSDNGSPDVFARRTTGDLDAFDTRWDDATGRLVTGYKYTSAVWGGDWNTYDRIESAGDIAGTQVFDTVARDKSGVLWLHQGDHVSTQHSPTRIGWGWGIYNQLAGGSDLTGDGRADLVAVDKAGGLYLYKGTGSASAPFAPRVKTGWGWETYNQITAVGNVAGGPAGDLVARDKAGVLWLHLGKGDGTYASRVKIGAGWNEYTDLVGIGDANKDGRPDLYVRAAGTNKAYFYAGTGNWRAPFAPRAATQVGVAPAGTTYNQVF